MNKLKALREEQGLSMMEIAKQLNMPYTTYVNYEKGTREPNSEMLIKFSKFFNVTIDYLIGNSEQKNKIFDGNCDERLETNIDDEAKFTSEEKTHIKKYRTLDEHGKKAVDCILNVEYERVEATRTPVIPISNVITLSEFEQPVSAGKGVYLGDGSQTITREVPNTEETRKADFILRVSGDSMEPKYSDGDRLLIKRQHDVKIGEEGIFILNNEGFVKRREVDRLVSLNPVYEDILFHDEDSVECKGKVIGKIQLGQIKAVDYPAEPVNRDERKDTVTIGIAARDGSSTLELTQEQYERLIELAQKEDTNELPDGII
ncbi:MAG: LexA family transcriptional regulator [Clostridiales bacterium]|nr:LexA family transcriptional regulator [Clostridiales bacterium]